MSERLWSRVADPNDNGCMMWTGATSHGYGSLRGPQGHTVAAHRMAFMLANPEVDVTGMSICHACDEPRCCNPEHLWMGSHADNMAYRQQKKRDAVGERNASSRLTIQTARTIRNLYETTGESQRGLARRFGVSQSTIGALLRRSTWREPTWSD